MWLRLRRRAIVWLVPGLAVGVTMFLLIARAGQLPDPMATGWSSDGTPIQSSPRLLELAVGGFLVVLGAAFTGLAGLMVTRRFARMLIAFGHLASVGWAGHRWRVVAANVAADRWTEAAGPRSLTVVVAAALVAGVWGWVVSGWAEPVGPSARGGSGAGGS